MPDAFPDDPRDLEAQDEVLQVMFWLRGENLADDVSPADVARFTGASPDAARAVLVRLVERALVSVRRGDVEQRFALTADGIREGGRRFADGHLRAELESALVDVQAGRVLETRRAAGPPGPLTAPTAPERDPLEAAGRRVRRLMPWISTTDRDARHAR